LQHISWKKLWPVQRYHCFSSKACSLPGESTINQSRNADWMEGSKGFSGLTAESNAVHHIGQDEQQQKQQQHYSQLCKAVARVLDGKTIATEWSEQLQHQVPELQAALGRAPGLAVVLVGR
jgi:hypothetical protein